MKSIPKTNISFNIYHLPTSAVLNRKPNIKTMHPISLSFFPNLLSFDSRVFNFFVFCISSNNRSSQCLFAKFTSKHLCQSP